MEIYGVNYRFLMFSLAFINLVSFNIIFFYDLLEITFNPTSNNNKRHSDFSFISNTFLHNLRTYL